VTFTVNKVFSEALVGINGGMWSRSKLRKPCDCAVCGKTIKKNVRAYRTLNEGKLRPRYARICEGCVEDGKRKLEAKV
jgi:hypothetical protein